MIGKIKIGVKFCGNCNPYVDMVSMLSKIKESVPNAEFVSWEVEIYSLLILLSGCPSGCVTIPDYSGPKTMITSNSINYSEVGAERLLDETLKVLNEFINKKLTEV